MKACQDMACDVNYMICFQYYVRSALDSQTGKRVAIKKLSRPFETSIHSKRSYRELRLLRHMNHENVSVWVWLLGVCGCGC